MATSIWNGSALDNARETYLELAKQWKNDKGDLTGFLNAHGALLTKDGRVTKVRIKDSTGRLSTVNLFSYDKYQQARSSREGYDLIRQDLLAAEIDPAEIEQFIEEDKILYKQKVANIPKGFTKGHIIALKIGGRDGSWNIESESPRSNYSSQTKSPNNFALLAEGTPRTSKEAFIRAKIGDNSLLPNPEDYTREQRHLLRNAATEDEINDLLTKFDANPTTPYVEQHLKRSTPLFEEYIDRSQNPTPLINPTYRTRTPTNSSSFKKYIEELYDSTKRATNASPVPFDGLAVGVPLAVVAAGHAFFTGGDPVQAAGNVAADFITGDLDGGTMGHGTRESQADELLRHNISIRRTKHYFPNPNGFNGTY